MTGGSSAGRRRGGALKAVTASTAQQQEQHEQSSSGGGVGVCKFEEGGVLQLAGAAREGAGKVVREGSPVAGGGAGGRGGGAPAGPAEHHNRAGREGEASGGGFLVPRIGLLFSHAPNLNFLQNHGYISASGCKVGGGFINTELATMWPNIGDCVQNSRYAPLWPYSWRSKF